MARDFFGWRRSTYDGPKTCDPGLHNLHNWDWTIGGCIYRVYNQGSRCLRRAVKVIGDWRLRVK